MYIQLILDIFSRKLINLLNFNKDEDNMFYVAQLEKACVEKKYVYNTKIQID